MEFCLLGPLVVRNGGAVLRVQGGRQRAILAALLLDANRVVPVDDLAEVLWGSGPPPSARASIQNHVMRLRKALGDGGGPLIGTRPGGYVIRVDQGQLDVACFEALAAAARTAARSGGWDTAAARTREALALWRGEPLADVESEVLAVREVPRLAELRLQVLEEAIGADLRLGRDRAVIGELRQLVAANPLRERLSCLLMVALYRDGRQGEALATYQHAREVLVEELGAEPGTALSDLHQRILAADPALGQLAPTWADGGAPAQPAGSPKDADPLPLALRTAASLATVRHDMPLADRVLHVTDAHLSRPRATTLAHRSGQACLHGGYRAPARHAEGQSRPSRAARASWSGHASRVAMLAGAALAVSSLIFAAVLWGGFIVGGSLHPTTGLPLTRSPDGAVPGDGASPVRADCVRDAVTLAFAPVTATSDGPVVGLLQLDYSAACHSTWARFKPMPGRPLARSPAVDMAETDERQHV